MKKVFFGKPEAYRTERGEAALVLYRTGFCKLVPTD
jgi:hypothetical protein